MCNAFEALRDAISDKKAIGQCTTCNGPATSFRDQLSAREHSISGMCQRCQDEIFGECYPGCGHTYHNNRLENEAWNN